METNRRMALVSILACIAIALAVVTPAYYLPGKRTPPLGGIEPTLEITDLQSIALVSVSGDVKLTVFGSWEASGPTWQTWGYSQPNPGGPICYLRCGPPATSGRIGYWGEFCTTIPGGGGSDYLNGRNLTVDLVFATVGSTTDTVSFQVEWILTPSNDCG